MAADNARRLGARVGFVVCDLMAGHRAGSHGPDRLQPALRARCASAKACSAKCATGSRTWRCSPARRGFEIYDRIVADAPRVLRPGGWLIMELGFGCAGSCVRACSPAGATCAVEPDLAGIPRVIAARR